MSEIDFMQRAFDEAAETYQRGELMEGISTERVEELASAEREGRVVVLPCKVGDTVYKLWYTPCRNGNDYPDGMMCDGCMDACDIKEAVIPFKFYNQSHIIDMLDSYGSHWYLTEAEAERALAATEPKGDAT